jgi:hypothetical protein
MTKSKLEDEEERLTRRSCERPKESRKIGRRPRGSEFQCSRVPLGFGHDGYMPPEVAKKLKEQGVWRGDATAVGPASQSKVN